MPIVSINYLAELSGSLNNLIVLIISIHTYYKYMHTTLLYQPSIWTLEPSLWTLIIISLEIEPSLWTLNPLFGH